MQQLADDAAVPYRVPGARLPPRAEPEPPQPPERRTARVGPELVARAAADGHPIVDVLDRLTVHRRELVAVPPLEQRCGGGSSGGTRLGRDDVAVEPDRRLGRGEGLQLVLAFVFGVHREEPKNEKVHSGAEDGQTDQDEDEAEDEVLGSTLDVLVLGWTLGVFVLPSTRNTSYYNVLLVLRSTPCTPQYKYVQSQPQYKEYSGVLLVLGSTLDVLVSLQSHVVAEADGGKRDDAVVDGVEVRPRLVAAEHPGAAGHHNARHIHADDDEARLRHLSRPHTAITGTSHYPRLVYLLIYLLTCRQCIVAVQRQEWQRVVVGPGNAHFIPVRQVSSDAVETYESAVCVRIQSRIESFQLHRILITKISNYK